MRHLFCSFMILNISCHKRHIKFYTYSQKNYLMVRGETPSYDKKYLRVSYPNNICLSAFKKGWGSNGTPCVLLGMTKNSFKNQVGVSWLANPIYVFLHT